MKQVRTSIVSAVARKELLDTLRDRRTIATMLLVPMVSYPLLVLALTEAVSVEREASRARVTRIQPLSPLPDPLASALASSEDLLLLDTSTIATASTSVGRARKALKDGADVVIDTATDAELALLEGRTASIALYYDETSRFGGAGLDRVEDALYEQGRALRNQRLAERGLEPELAVPITLSRKSVSTSREVGGQLASLYLPMIILMFTAIACFYPAIDLTAGEKERGTLATLLTAPIRAFEVVIGKYVAVVAIGTIAGLLNVTVIALTILRALTAATPLSPAIPGLEASLIAGALICVVLTAALSGAVMLLVASFARSFRDGSNLLAPVLLVLMAPAFLTTLPSAQLTPGWAAVPVAGIVLWLKALILGQPAAQGGFVVIVSTILVTALLLALAARVFDDEEVLFSSEGKRANLRGLILEAPDPGFATAIAFVALLFAGNYFAGLFVRGAAAHVQVMITQIAVHIGAALLFSRWMRDKIAPRDLIPLRAPSITDLFAGALIGIGAWLGVALPTLWAQSELMPGQEAASRALKETLGIGEVPIGTAILALAIIPAVAEEIALRGVVLGLLVRRLGTTGAIVLQAILFGLLHGSVFRLLPTAFLGVFLGVLTLKTRSLWPAILAHAISNSIILLVDRFGPPEIMERLSGPSPIALFGLVAIAIALWLLKGARLTDEKPAS